MGYTGTKTWKVLDRQTDDIFDQILLNRNIPLDQKDIFLKPDFNRDIHEPNLLKNIPEAVRRIAKAYKKGETIGIFADYDADGVTSCVLLEDCLMKIGIKTLAYIPAREEGYGLNITGIDYFKSKNVTLMIAVDMGVTGKSEVDYAHKIGIETIVIDHHLVQQDKLPSGIVINPRQVDDTYPFKDLSACGLVYKLTCALQNKFPDLLDSSLKKWWLDLVAISTIADMVPLIGENRVLAYFGLIVLKKTRRLGLSALYSKASIDKDLISPSVVGFQIAPRLNAPGRIDHANLAYNLLTQTDIAQATKVAGEIELVNKNRQDELQRIIAEARQKIIKNSLEKNKVILVSNKGWQPGLVGLVAGRLMEEFARPVIVLEEFDGGYRGSARSIEAFHLLDAFQHVSEYLKTYGGHARAGGLSFEMEHFDHIYTLLLEYAEKKLDRKDMVPVVTVDGEIINQDITLKFAKLLDQFNPYGFANPRPVFIMRSQVVSDVAYIGKEKKHRRIKVGTIKGIQFDGGLDNKEINNGDIIDLVFTVQINKWNGNESAEIIIIDWVKSDMVK